MNQTSITHTAFELWDQNWTITVLIAGVRVNLDCGRVVELGFDDLKNAEMLADHFGFMRVTAFKHLVTALGEVDWEHTQ